MGMPENQLELPATYHRMDCPKYNWTKMDAFERTGVNLMDAVGAKNAVFGGLFGLFIFIIAMLMFRKHLSKILLGEFLPNQRRGKPPYDVKKV